MARCREASRALLWTQRPIDYAPLSLNVACVVCELQDEQCGSFARQSNRATLRNIFPADFSHEIMNEIVGPMVLADIAVGSASDDLRRVSCSVRWRQEISVCTSCV